MFQLQTSSLIILIIPIIVIITFINTVECIQCYECNSNVDSYCTEFFDEQSEAKPNDCANTFEAKYCIKTTGMYDGERGTKRFCSSRDLGKHCEYVSRPGDDRKFRSCVYTCYSDGCNHSYVVESNMLVNFLMLVVTAMTAAYLTNLH